MNVTQIAKPTQPLMAQKPILAVVKPKKFLAYNQDELKKSIERKEKRKVELQTQIQKLDEKISERKARLQELSKKIN